MHVERTLGQSLAAIAPLYRRAPKWLASSLAGVVVRLGDHRLNRRLLPVSCPAARREHRAASGPNRGKAGEANLWLDVVVDRLHATAHEVGLVPKACSTRVFEEPLPPELVRVGAGPPLQALKVPPVLAHTEVRRISDQMMSSCNKRPFGCCFQDRLICSPVRNSRSIPLGRLTHMPR